MTTNYVLKTGVLSHTETQVVRLEVDGVAHVATLVFAENLANRFAVPNTFVEGLEFYINHLQLDYGLTSELCKSMLRSRSEAVRLSYYEALKLLDPNQLVLDGV